MSRYERYFTQHQVGGGISDIGYVHRSPQHLQRGRGLFGGIIRWLTPLLLSSGKAIGKEALKSGAEILGNWGNQPINQLMKAEKEKILKNLAAKAGNKLKRMGDEMSGDGIKRRKRSSKKTIKASLQQLITPKKKTVKRLKKKGSKKKKSVKKRVTKKSNSSASRKKIEIIKKYFGG